MLLRGLACLALCGSVGALRGSPHRARIHQTTSQASKAVAVTAALCSTLVCTTPPALAASLDDAIVEVSETSYPIIQALKKETFAPFSQKIAKLVLDIRPEKLGKSVDLGIDVFQSVPESQRTAFTKSLKDAFADLKTDSCTLVPLPPPSIGEEFKAIATQAVDATKLKQFEEAWGPALSALSKTEAGRDRQCKLGGGGWGA